MWHTPCILPRYFIPSFSIGARGALNAPLNIPFLLVPSPFLMAHTAVKLQYIQPLIYRSLNKNCPIQTFAHKWLISKKYFSGTFFFVTGTDVLLLLLLLLLWLLSVQQILFYFHFPPLFSLNYYYPIYGFSRVATLIYYDFF